MEKPGTSGASSCRSVLMSNTHQVTGVVDWESILDPGSYGLQLLTLASEIHSWERQSPVTNDLLQK